MFQASVLCDSIAADAEKGSRLTTFELTYPRFIHAELMTHRVFSRNSSSSRAIPVKKMIQDVVENPVIPIHWGQNEKGMQASGELRPSDIVVCRRAWLEARDNAVKSAERMIAQGLHKQIANRLLEPWMWITVIVSSTTYENFFKLRCHEAAEPHMQKLAYMMRDSYNTSEPVVLGAGEWHLPFVTEADRTALTPVETLIKKSVARCARGSYLQQHGKFDYDNDCVLHDRMVSMGHWSPFEHQAMVGYSVGGNFGNGWRQYRKTFPGENGLCTGLSL